MIALLVGILTVLFLIGSVSPLLVTDEMQEIVVVGYS